MCLAIYKPKGTVVSEEYLMSGFYSNCSGSGFMFHDRGTLKVVKDLFSFKEFYKAITDAGQEEHDMGIHFRAATHGPVNKANCHPFEMCNGKWAMLHNGIFHIPLTRKDLSDTGNYSIQVLEPAIKAGTYKNLKEMQADPRWGWGAVVLMSAAGEVLIYNEGMGHWHEGVWYSNHAYRYGNGFGSYLKRRTELNYKPTERIPDDSIFTCEGGCD